MGLVRGTAYLFFHISFYSSKLPIPHFGVRYFSHKIAEGIRVEMETIYGDGAANFTLSGESAALQMRPFNEVFYGF